MAGRSQDWYFALLGGFACLRLVELGVSLRHQTRLLAEGGEKVPEPFYPLMVGIHAGLFLASGPEVWRRIRYEEGALCARPEYVAKMGTKPRFLPALSRGR